VTAVTEDEWLTRNAPKEMLVLARRKRATDRQLRLYACACLRAVWDLLTDPVGRGAVEVAEQFADGHADRLRLSVAGREVQLLFAEPVEATLRWLLVAVSGAATSGDVGMGAWLSSSNTRSIVRGGPFLRHQAGLLRCIVGNPFRKRPELHPDWLTWNDSTIRNLAVGIYEEQAFDRLPILGDALEDAGCTDRVILEHCRSSGPHVRGCWLIDAILGKS
jgi:hypothetical protein